MTTTMKTALGLVAALALATLSACGDSGNNNNTPDMAMQQGNNDMTMVESCVMNPTTPVELLNACTDAQTGDPAKDAPYFPSLAPGGNLPPLP